MKTVLFLEGSPRPAGNTALVTDWVVAGLGRRGVRVERVRLADLDVGNCRACFTCSSRRDAPGCCQDDDMVGVYDRVVAADLVVFTSPVYCWGITGRAKTVLDRFFALLSGENLLRGKSLAVVVTAGGDAFDGADLVVAMFRNLCRYAGMEYAGQYVAAPCPDRPALARNARVRADARGFGAGLRRSLLSR
ncbi:MAG: flavodoxin family protein [bacterium]